MANFMPNAQHTKKAQRACCVQSQDALPHPANHTATTQPLLHSSSLSLFMSQLWAILNLFWGIGTSGSRNSYPAGTTSEAQALSLRRSRLCWVWDVQRSSRDQAPLPQAWKWFHLKHVCLSCLITSAQPVSAVVLPTESTKPPWVSSSFMWPLSSWRAGAPKARRILNPDGSGVKGPKSRLSLPGFQPGSPHAGRCTNGDGPCPHRVVKEWKWFRECKVLKPGQYESWLFLFTYGATRAVCRW